MTDIEIWRDIPGYGGVYQASTHGRIRSLDRVEKWRGAYRKRRGSVMVGHIEGHRPGHGGGYMRVVLCQEGRMRTYVVHKLILATFVGPRPEGMDICHADGNPANNRLDNLRYDSRAGNMADNVRLGVSIGEAHCHSKLTYEAVQRMRRGELSVKEASEVCGCSYQAAHNAKAGKTWAHVNP